METEVEMQGVGDESCSESSCEEIEPKPKNCRKKFAKAQVRIWNTLRRK